MGAFDEETVACAIDEHQHCPGTGTTVGDFWTCTCPCHKETTS